MKESGIGIASSLGCLLGLAQFVSPSQLQAQDAKALIGPFLPQPAAALYLISDGEPVKARLTVRNGSKPDGDRLLVRAFDPDERLSAWKYAEPGRPDLQTPGDVELNGIPSLIPGDAKLGDVILEMDVPVSGKGVNQLRVVAGACNSGSQLELSRPLQYGISFQNGDFSPWGGPSTLYAYVPRNAEVLNVSGGPLTIVDDAGKTVYDGKEAKLGEPSAIKVERTDAVWTFKIPKDGWKFRAWGFPLILCPSKEAALKIKASIEILPDGTVVCHKFQRKIAEILPKLLAPENVGKAEEIIVPLASKKEEWLKDPLRNLILISPWTGYSGVEQALRNQNVDPSSHWGGANGGTGDAAGHSDASASWIELQNQPPPLNRWDRLCGTPGLWAGASPRVSEGHALAIAATLDTPANPYFHDSRVIYRAAAAALRDLMTVNEDETLRGVGAEADPYPGNMAFPIGQKTLPPYSLIAPLMPQDVKEVWTEALRHVVDRMYPVGLVSCRNQSSHFLVAFQEFAMGSGDPDYARLAKAYSRRFIAGLNPAGFAVEEQGPDMTYNGMTHWHMGLYAKLSGDKDMVEAVRKSYFFFNHTVAPEPDGATMLGASNMGHRTSGSFVNEQWGGSKGILDDLVPEVALWKPQLSPEAQAALESSARASLEKALSAKFSMRGNIDIAKYECWSKPLRGAQWPALESESFTRCIGGELVAVKRPSYYMAVYVGKPVPNPHYIRNREKFRLPIAGDAENQGGKSEKYRATPFLGGGLSMFWTKSYGSAILATNWAPTTHNGLVATKDGGLRYWEDYFSTKWELAKDNSELRVSGSVESLPLSYERVYKLLDDRLEVSLTLKASKDVSLQSLVENIPFPLGELKKGGVEVSAPASGSKASITDLAGHGVEISFDKDLAMRVQRNGIQYDRVQIGRIEVALPSKLAAGESFVLSYGIAPK